MTTRIEKTDLARDALYNKVNIMIDEVNTKVSNCITEIPQDIKLELNNGTLILKTGSKLYVPNGAGVFNIITMNVDAILGQLWNSNNQVFVVYTPALGTLNLRTPADCSSGSTDSLSRRFHFWYDTTNNLIKAVEASGTVRAEYTSFPLALVTMIGDGTASVKSIDQVFNGFGYIGSTVFILPGVKGLIPNGRNEDGSLNNIVWTNTIVRTMTYSAATTALDIRRDGWFGDIAPVYDEEKNLLTTDGTDRWMNAGVISSESTGRITSFTPKTAFHAVDYNDFSDMNNNKVSKSGDTMTGRIDFHNNYDLIWNVTPAAGNTQMSMILGNSIKKDGTTYTNLATRKVVNGKELYSVLQTFITADGQIGTLCPGCKFDNSILTNITHGTNYVRLGNGLIIQWIYFDNTGATTWIFPTPFSNTNYAILSNASVWYNTANKKTTLIQITDTNFGNSSKFVSYYLLAIGY